MAFYKSNNLCCPPVPRMPVTTRIYEPFLGSGNPNLGPKPSLATSQHPGRGEVDPRNNQPHGTPLEVICKTQPLLQKKQLSKAAQPEKKTTFGDDDYLFGRKTSGVFIAPENGKLQTIWDFATWQVRTVVFFGRNYRHYKLPTNNPFSPSKNSPLTTEKALPRD